MKLKWFSKYVGLIALFVMGISLSVGAQATPNVATVLSTTPSLSIFTGALKTRQYLPVLQGKGNFTVFAPVNAAFAKLPGIQNTLKANNVWTKKAPDDNILLFHVIPSNLLMSKISKQSIGTAEGQNITVVTEANGKMQLEYKGTVANVIGGPIKASNGVVYLIDTILIPA